MLESKTKELYALSSASSLRLLLILFSLRSIEMPALTFQEAKARVLGAERANEAVRKGSHEWNEIMKLLRLYGGESLQEKIMNTDPNQNKVPLNFYDTRTVNPLRREFAVKVEKEQITKEEFLNVEVNRKEYGLQLLRHKHLRNL